MNFNSPEYLPNSEERVNHLRKIIDGRPVAILAAGPSIKELEKRINKLRHADICYFGLNNFSPQETHILQQIGTQYSIVMCSDHRNLSKYSKDIIDFLSRDEDNIFVSSFWRDTNEPIAPDIYYIINRYDKKLIFFSISLERTVPNCNHPLHFILSNSLLVLIQIGIIGKASKILLFGADGYCKDNGEQYYNNQCGNDDVRKISVIDDTNKYFNPIAPIAIKNMYKTYNIARIDILNCSEDSAYTPFPKVSYDNAFEYLLRSKNFLRKIDLRIPKVSVISPYLMTGDFIKETVESISQQSYTNHEHIIIYSEIDDNMQDIGAQYPSVRLIQEKNIDYIQMVKKGISMARGEYIFLCSIGNGYLNQDWLNTCVEIMENNPDISLVWGLSQNMYEDGALGRIDNALFFDKPPAQGKYFIYYWLEKKVIFPEGNFCVRKNVLEESYPFNDAKARNEREAWVTFNYKFNMLGYQPYFVPIIANYRRTHGSNEGQGPNAGQGMRNKTKEYLEDIQQYKKQLIQGKTVHKYRTGSGELLPDGFCRSIFFIFDTCRYIKTKLPNGCLAIIEKALKYWRTYRWSAFSIVTVKVWHRLIGKLKIQLDRK